MLTFADSPAVADIGLLARDPVAAFARQLRDAAPRRTLPDDLPPPPHGSVGTSAAELLAEAATYYGAAADLLATHLTPDGKLAAGLAPQQDDPEMGWAALAALAEGALAAATIDNDLVESLRPPLTQLGDGHHRDWASGVVTDATRTGRGGLAYTAEAVLRIADAEGQLPKPTYEPAGALVLRRPHTLAEAPLALDVLIAVLTRDPTAVTRAQLARLSLDLGEIAGLSSRLLYAAREHLPETRPESDTAIQSLLDVMRAWRNVRRSLGNFSTTHPAGIAMERSTLHIVRLLHTKTRHQQGWRPLGDTVPDAIAAGSTVAVVDALTARVFTATGAVRGAVNQLRAAGRFYSVNDDADATRPDSPLWVPCPPHGPFRLLAEHLEVAHDHSENAKRATRELRSGMRDPTFPSASPPARHAPRAPLATSSRPSAPWSRPQRAARASR